MARHMRLTKKQYDAILRAGTMCSNVCYNLAQGRSISNDNQRAMRESYKAWDIALLSVMSVKSRKKTK